MAMNGRALATRCGPIRFPAYIPVTTFGERYPLDKLIQPYLPRLAQAVMVSYHYAQKMDRRLGLPLMVDSGGFVSLFRGCKVKRSGRLGEVVVEREGRREILSPAKVLDFQEQVADVAFTLDFPIPPGTSTREAKKRFNLTLNNAHWALENRRRRDLPLYGVVQAWDPESARACARVYGNSAFEGVAIGGLVPRARNRTIVLDIVEAVRQEIGDKPLHVFGLGQPDLVADLHRAGVDSVDSSAYVKLAAEGRVWRGAGAVLADPTPLERLHLALCNLATASGRALPLSTYPLAFRTVVLPRR
ncbi:MAG: tRNA-guanine transglycosylase [Candidatus Competibacteraceae bacterium]